MINRTFSLFIRALLVFQVLCRLGLGAAPLDFPAPKQGAALLKTDILGVFAHPDDETGIGATLAQYALGKKAIVANVYCTRGEGGGNMVGTQSGAALGSLREAELRDCLSTLGVRYCYFLDRLDWAYTESLTATLQKWGKEETLERLVRLVRLLRPEIVVTMNPAPKPGQHGHHQAAGVLATEAFTAAADPQRFPAQLSDEGLSVWQPRRLFFSGGESEDVFTIAVNEPLPNGKTAGEVAGTALVNHRSQAFGNAGNRSWLERPQRFTLVKAFIPSSSHSTDLMEGLPGNDVYPTPISLGATPMRDSLSLEFATRPAFENYHRWVTGQGIEHIAVHFKADLPVISGQANLIQLRVSNGGTRPASGQLRIVSKEGWAVDPSTQSLTVAAGGNEILSLRVTPPADARADTEIFATFSGSGSTNLTKASLHPVPRGHAVHLSGPPHLDGSDVGWEKANSLRIDPSRLVEGKVVDEADSSAIFRVAHDGETLFVDVQVRDDVIVTNIAPNDIKGHWRSDSVEICVDPIGGAEHTLGCYKLGIFPFDTTGVVRAARDADANQGPVEQTAPKTRLVSKRTGDGYRIQAAIPFVEIGLRSGARQIGFNIIVYDGDKKDAALGENINKSRIAWAPRPGVQGRPEDWGRLDLD